MTTSPFPEKIKLLSSDAGTVRVQRPDLMLHHDGVPFSVRSLRARPSADEFRHACHQQPAKSSAFNECAYTLQRLAPADIADFRAGHNHHHVSSVRKVSLFLPAYQSRVLTRNKRVVDDKTLFPLSFRTKLIWNVRDFI